jgi:hypothetical protein
MTVLMRKNDARRRRFLRCVTSRSAMTTSLAVMALPPASPRCFACSTACEAVSHAWRDRLPRSPGGSKQRCVLKRGRRREYPTSGGGSLPARPELSLCVFRNAETDWSHGNTALKPPSEGVLRVIAAQQHTSLSHAASTLLMTSMYG